MIVDKGLMDEEEISIGSGMRDKAVILKSADLIKALGDAEVVNLAD
jgi:prolyl-tRNA editing enzyme YbaK/EbsC (Cys-tRNA(Pro) deacylase)